MKRAHASGLTLIEALAAVLVTAIALPVILQGISLASRATRSSVDRLEGSSLASSKLHELSAMIQASPTAALPSTGGDFGPDWPGFRWTATVVTADDGLDELTVVVTKGEPPAAKEYRLVTFVRRGGTQ